MKSLILLSLVAGAFAFLDCPENQHYNPCGTACPLTCDNYNDPPKACVLICNPGCHCDKGYVKTEDGSCVKPENCPSRHQEVCGDNEYFNECGTDCPLTCDNYDNPPKICNLMCRIGCACVEGYVRSAEGKCVRPEQCPRRSEEKNCHDEHDSGLCRAYMPMWYYDTEAATCKRFIYGGCGGNGNRYATEEECLNKCSKPQASSEVCELPVKRGMCLAYIPRFYFDKTTGECKEFIYGGCQGNGNNFKTLDECKNTCGNHAAALDRPDCDKAPETGVCRARIDRFYYDQQAGMCKTFIYGGCGGNRNNFQTEDECYNKCGALASDSIPTCEQEKVDGPCMAAFRRYYYNKQSGECEQFTYGGCHANDNNFLTKEDCEAVCVKQ